MQLVLFMLYVLIRDSLHAGRYLLDWFVTNVFTRMIRLYLDVSMLSIGLGSNLVLCVLESYLLISFLLVYPFFKVQKKKRTNSPMPQFCSIFFFQLWNYVYCSSVPKWLSGIIFTVLFASYVVSSAVLVGWTSLSFPLPPFTTIILSVEQVS